ncbi:MAG: ornithine carbamoyltransferase [Deltaproteobacteria bacterium]|nr:ornithine carbamoyltransferase [Deltaproteobacteria bacterium]
MSKKDIISLSDFTKDEFHNLFDRAFELKDRHKKGIVENSLAAKTVGLIFEKKSTRTRISFEAAAAQLGATPLFISATDTQLARSEPIPDAARVLSRYLDALVLRTYSQDTIADFGKYCDIPVINALSDMYHPCQILSDLMTVMEKKKFLENLKIAWVGDGNNMAHSWINAASVLGFCLSLACPVGYEPDQGVLDRAAKKSGKRILVCNDPVKAVSGANVINTDVWASMGQEAEAEARKSVFEPFQVNAQLVSLADKDAIVMHCLPAHRGEEISEEVLEGPQSVVWDQAENKLHMHKALLEMLVAGA